MQFYLLLKSLAAEGLVSPKFAKNIIKRNMAFAVNRTITNLFSSDHDNNDNQ